MARATTRRIHVVYQGRVSLEEQLVTIYKISPQSGKESIYYIELKGTNTQSLGFASGCSSTCRKQPHPEGMQNTKRQTDRNSVQSTRTVQIKSILNFKGITAAYTRYSGFYIGGNDVIRNTWCADVHFLFHRRLGLVVDVFVFLVGVV